LGDVFGTGVLALALVGVLACATRPRSRSAPLTHHPDRE
jgi:hypothetical protein